MKSGSRTCAERLCHLEVEDAIPDELRVLCHVVKVELEGEENGSLNQQSFSREEEMRRGLTETIPSLSTTR